MSFFTPTRRWQPAFYTFKKEKFGRCFLRKTELFVKSPLFGCLTDKILTRMKKAGTGAPEEGIQIALELIESIKKKKGVNGIHIMSLGWESIVRRIVIDSGLLRL